jgi:hypothetical protein
MTPSKNEDGSGGSSLVRCGGCYSSGGFVRVAASLTSQMKPGRRTLGQLQT